MKKRSGRRDRFTRVANATVDDNRLDVLTFGLHTIFVRCVDGYDINVDEIARRRGPDRRKLYPAMRLLVELGYVMKVKYQDAGGKWQTEMVVFDTPAEPDEGFAIAYEYLNEYKSVRVEPAWLDPRGKPSEGPEPTSKRRDVGGDLGKRPPKKANVQVATDIHNVRPAGDRQVGQREANKEEEVGKTREKKSSGDGRRPPTGSKGASSGGCAAPASDPSPPKPTLPWATIRLVLEAIPKPLAGLLDKRYEHQGMPEALNERVMQALEGPRTVAELHERIGRRWMRYEDDALSLSGRGIQEPIAVLYELLAPSYCEGNNPRCEDGVDLDRGQECRICEELKAEFHASRLPVAADVPPVPEQRDVVAEEPRGPLRAACSVCSAWRIQVAVWEGRPVCASCIQTCTACQTMQPEFNYGPDSGECRGCRQLAPAPF